MTKLTKREREIVLDAAGIMAQGHEIYSCDALRAAGASIFLISDYARFYGKRIFAAYWINYPEVATTQERRDIRVLWLLTFAEVLR